MTELGIRIKAAGKVLLILFNCLMKTRSEDELIKAFKYECNALRKQMELTSVLRSTFPSGGKKIISNYVKYKNAKQFGTRMKYISLFKNDLKALEHDGILRQYIESMDSLNHDLKQEILARISELKEKKRDKPGTIEQDLSNIQEDELRLFYTQCLNDEHTKQGA